MSSSLRIKDVAERSGFSAGTLRYYEQIGIVPAPTRTPAGYRAYDEALLERLAFIARAKQLGCSLDEIAGLASAWEGGECGPVQDRLLELVQQKLADAHERIRELTVFAAELAQAATQLSAHRPAGACDDRCGCTTVRFVSVR